MTERHLAAIGLIIVEWGWMEHNFEWSVAELAADRPILKWTDEPAARILTTGMGVNTLMGLFRGLAIARFPKDKKEIEKFIDMIRKSYVARNIMGHGHWTKGAETGSIQTFTFKAVGSLRAEKHTFTIEQLERLAYVIAEQRGYFVAFLQSRGFFQPPQRTSDISPPLKPQLHTRRRPLTREKASPPDPPAIPHKSARPPKSSRG
ncbi:MAG: hypothetical protein ACYDDA_10960 [Acidiferrobacteraceae bacterium]